MSEQGNLHATIETDKCNFESENNNMRQKLDKAEACLLSADKDLESSGNENQDNLQTITNLKTNLENRTTAFNAELEKFKDSNKVKNELMLRLKEMETEIEIKAKSVSKLEAEIIKTSSDSNSGWFC